MGEGTTMTYPPLIKNIEIPLPPAEAFELFTTGIARWWPLPTHSVAEDHATSCVFETKVGGRIYEIVDDGTEHEWGRVDEFEPPTRVTYDWYPGRDATTAQKVEVTFTESNGGTDVRLVHTGWETLGELAQEQRDNYDTGWDAVLGQLVEFASG